MNDLVVFDERRHRGGQWLQPDYSWGPFETALRIGGVGTAEDLIFEHTDSSATIHILRVV